MNGHYALCDFELDVHESLSDTEVSVLAFSARAFQTAI